MPRVFACVLILAAGCAARAPRTPLRSVADADTLANAGCYACLLDALEIYDAHLARRITPAAVKGAFRTSVLLYLREKELGLPATQFLDRARLLATSLTIDGKSDLFLRVAEAVPWDYASLAKEDYEEWLKTHQLRGSEPEAMRKELAALLPDAFVAYLDASIACHYGDFRERDRALGPLLAAHPSSLLVKYRVGACVQQRRSELEEVLAAEPRYTEAHLFLGRYALADAAVGKGRRGEIAPHMKAAYDAFDKSPSVTFTLAGMYRAFNKLKEAQRYYEETLALVPTHREALLGRTIALSYLDRPDEAFDSASRLIELGTWYLGDAYYWRAFNRHAQKRLDAAREEIEKSKERAGLRADVFLMSGIIYHDRLELDAAVLDLEKSLQLNGDGCDAAWYLGLVRAGQRNWAAAGELFPRAARCYRANADSYRAELRVVQNTVAGTPDAEEVAADYARYVDRELVSEARSYYNAAYAAAQTGDRALGIDYAERAAQHAVMKDKAAELIAALRK